MPERFPTPSPKPRVDYTPTNFEKRKLRPEELRLVEEVLLLRLRGMRAYEEITPAIESIRDGRESTTEERHRMEQGLTRLETLFDALEEFACNHLGLKESEVDQIITNLGETPEGRAELGQ